MPDGLGRVLENEENVSPCDTLGYALNSENAQEDYSSHQTGPFNVVLKKKSPPKLMIQETVITLSQ